MLTIAGGIILGFLGILIIIKILNNFDIVLPILKWGVFWLVVLIGFTFIWNDPEFKEIINNYPTKTNLDIESVLIAVAIAIVINIFTRYRQSKK
jgi:predicted tellurium resistance membrane protein TerC